jgi:RimJ/RimL family protein N-acetyltransferase
MPSHWNDLGQPIGEPVPDWKPCRRPPATPMNGRVCVLEPLDPASHSDALYQAYCDDREGRNWTYLPYGPFGSGSEYRAFTESMAVKEDPSFYAIVLRETGLPVGVASYLRIDPPMGSIEVGHLSYAPKLQRTVPATEAMFLMMGRAFEELGYRRYEWKCDSLNAPSRAAAERLGFRYEGTFLNQVVMKARNRDTAWFSITDREWPAVRDALVAWLEPSNFDENGTQRRSLGDFRGS